LFNKVLEKNGLLVKRGTVVDATLVESSRRPRKVMDMEGCPAEREEEESSCEPEEPLGLKVSYSEDVELYFQALAHNMKKAINLST
jgi:IS5 family transposase